MVWTVDVVLRVGMESVEGTDKSDAKGLERPLWLACLETGNDRIWKEKAASGNILSRSTVNATTLHALAAATMVDVRNLYRCKSC